MGALYLLFVATMGVVWTVEATARRRGNPHPWIYGWAASCLCLSLGIAALGLHDGWGLAWSLGSAVLIGPTAFPVLRNLMEGIRTSPRRVYVDDGYDDPPLNRPLYQATSFGGGSEPIRVEKAPEPSPPPAPLRVFRWQDANIPEFRRAAVVTLATLAVMLAGVTSILYRPPPPAEVDVQAFLADEGFHAVRVRPADDGDNCPAGSAKPYAWTALGVAGRACRSPSGRVTYWVERTWGRDNGRRTSN